jgi:predicted Zn finger-like uncharacterized protein
MSLITRCPACGTLFKVVADQLKISQGWVRCGQCSEVFDAQAHMNSPELGLSVNPAQPSSGVPQTPAPARGSSVVHAAELASSASAIDLTELDISYFEVNKLEAHADTAQAAIKNVAFKSSGLDHLEDFASSDWVNNINPPAPPHLPEQGDHSDELHATADTAAEPAPAAGRVVLRELPAPRPGMPPVATPSFVRQAQRAQRWRSPWVRAALSLMALLLLGMLGLQIAVHERDQIAARQPQSLPYLQMLCEHMACTVQPYKQIDAMVIDTSSFNKLRGDNKTELYKLSFSVKNTSQLSLATPHIELSLQDAQDRSVLRRVLRPDELGAPHSVLAPGTEWTGGTSIQINTARLVGSRIAGYRVLAFYP